MKIYIKDLDLVRVVQALYRHAFPAGIGIGVSYKYKVEELSRKEAEDLLISGVKTVGDKKVISIDYVNGRPIKFEYVIDEGLAYTTSYDVRNGKYRFIEALSQEFGPEKIKIIRKSYDSGLEFANPDDRAKEIKRWQRAIKENTWNQMLPKN